MPEGTAGRLIINSETFGVIISSRKNPRVFQIYSHDGELIRSTITEGLGFLSDQEQFSRIGGGYLISGKEWCWMHPDSEITINRLSPPGDAIPEIDPWWSDRFNWFSAPLIYDEHIFVISRYGSVYIFNAEKYRGLL